jgi:HAD-superfamily subfamily IB hydrolase, TIGR01490
MYIAFFDLDHTILNTSSGRFVFRESYRHGIIGRKELFKALLFTVLYRLGIMNEESIIKRWLGWYRGISIEAFAPIASDWVKELQSVIRNDARKEVQLHRDNGGRTVILSASTTFFCEQVKNALGMDDVICTELEVIDGRLTGNLKGRYCHGREKLLRARRYCLTQGVDMKDCYYYADSINDLPMLEEVGIPVCVTPDKKLERIAMKQGWRISRWE